MTVKELKEYLVDKDDNIDIFVETYYGEYPATESHCLEISTGYMGIIISA